MQVSVENVGTLERRMTFRLPAQDLETQVGGRLREMARTARIKGFRPGKVPRRILEQRYKQEVEGDVVQRLVQRYRERPAVELYDLEADPAEQNDVFSEHPEVAERLGDLLQAYLEKTGAYMPKEDTAFDPVLAKKQHQERVAVLMPKLEAQRMEFLSEDFEPNPTWWNSQVIGD